MILRIYLHSNLFTLKNIIEVYEMIRDYKFKEPIPGKSSVLTETHILKMLKLDAPNFIRYSYIIDRLTFNEKVVLLYAVLSNIHGNIVFEDDGIQSFFNDYMIPFFEPLFLYYDTQFMSLKIV